MRLDINETSFIEADAINLGERVTFGNNVRIKVRGEFSIGNDSHVGDRFTANAENIRIGKFFYNGPTDSRGMVIGGGGCAFPYADLIIGDRMVCHTGHINLARPVTIGNDVGLSHDVDIITHGFWGSVLEGYPNMFEEVKIGNNVIIGWKCVIMGDVTIADNIVVGAHSTVIKSLTHSKGIYVGSPAKMVRVIEEPSISQKLTMLDDIKNNFLSLLAHYNVTVPNINYSNTNLITIDNLNLCIDTMTCNGEHTEITDAFRDFLRRYGLRFFSEGRPFKFNLPRNIL